MDSGFIRLTQKIRVKIWFWWMVQGNCFNGSYLWVNMAKPILKNCFLFTLYILIFSTFLFLLMFLIDFYFTQWNFFCLCRFLWNRISCFVVWLGMFIHCFSLFLRGVFQCSLLILCTYAVTWFCCMNCRDIHSLCVSSNVSLS